MCVCRTKQDRDGCHHAAAEGEHDAPGRVGAVGWFDGDVEIESVEYASSAEQRGQDGEESWEPAAPAAAALAAAAAAAGSLLGGLLGCRAGLPAALGAPHGQLHALWGRGYQGSPLLVGGRVQVGGLWTPPRVGAVGNISLSPRRSRTADSFFFRPAIQVARRRGRTGNTLIQLTLPLTLPRLLPLLAPIRPRLVWEVVPAGLPVARSAACWEQKPEADT